jgi:isopenicillin N synthase-like dioxygenase
MSKVNADATSFQLPLVDFTPFSSNDSDTSNTLEQQQLVTQEINDANHTRGFFCLRSSGISKSKLQAAVHVSQDLFISSTPLIHGIIRDMLEMVLNL